MIHVYDLRVSDSNKFTFDTQSGSFVIMNTSHVLEGTNFFYTETRVNNNNCVQKGLQAFAWNNHSTQGYVTFKQLVNRIYSYTGDITGSGSNGINLTINPNAVTFSKIQNINGNNLLGRVNGNGNVQTIALTSGLALSGATLGLINSGILAGTYNKIIFNSKGIAIFGSNIPYLTSNQKITITGDITATGTTGMVATLATVNSNIGSFNYLNVNGKGLVISAQNKPYLTGNQTINVTGDISGSGSTGLTLTLPTVNSNIGMFNNVIVNGKGLVTSATNRDYITNQIITLSGDITGNGSSGITTTISTGAVTNTKIRQAVATSVIGRWDITTGTVNDIPATADGQFLRRRSGSLGFGGLASGDIPNSSVTFAKIQNINGNRLLGNIGGSGLVEEIQTTAGLSFSGTTLGITTNGITNTMIRQSSALSVIGRSANSTGNVADIAASSNGQVLKRVGNAVGFHSIGTSDLNNNTVTYSKIQNIGANKVMGNVGNVGVLEEIALTSGLAFSGLTLGLSNSVTTYKYNAGSAPTVGTGTKVFTGTATTNSSGVATFQATTDGTASGAALFTNIFSIAVNARNNTSTSTSVPNASVKTVTSGKTIDVNVTSGVVLLVLAATQIFVGAGIVVDITIVGN